ncbi:MAG TPA: DUF1223 domain-containing protein [Caulobacterales bacterium]|nr:DUF1223 domain-containing protein [Caulobacterales bacterium]
MRRFVLAAALALFAAATLGDTRAQTPPLASAAHPVVLELYTSQGCSACPRANRLVAQFMREPDIVALTFPVGYWDYLGWEDTFAQPQFTSRQRDFEHALQTRGPFTPQLVIGGVRQMSADDWDEARAAINEVRARSHEGKPRVTIARGQNGRVHVSISGETPRATPADIWFLTYDPGPLVVWVTRGDNANRTVLHYNLVETIARIGQWNGAATSFDRNRCQPQCVVIVQEQDGGQILGAAMTRRQGR